MLWCHWVTPQWTIYVISHLFLFVYIIPFYVFLSYHVPMFSLLMYFVRNDKNKDIQSINQSINQSILKWKGFALLTGRVKIPNSLSNATGPRYPNWLNRLSLCHANLNHSLIKLVIYRRLLWVMNKYRVTPSKQHIPAFPLFWCNTLHRTDFTLLYGSLIYSKLLTV